MKRLCCIFNIPSLYREAIYTELENHYDCEWYFENEEVDIALFDTRKLKSVNTLKHVNFGGRAYRMKGLLGKLWRRRDFDCYLIVGAPMCLSIWLLCCFLKLFRPQKKIYFWTHGWYGKESRIERIIKKTFLRLADGLFLYGNYAKTLLLKEGFKDDKLHVIHNSLSYDIQHSYRQQIKITDVYKKHFKNSYPVLLFIGRLTPVKKLDVLVDVLSMLQKRGKMYNVVFVGDGSEKGTLEEKVTKLNLREQVWFYGPCYNESTNAELIYNADLCVAPGNIGLTAIHVLMYGCPAMTHNDFPYQMPEFEAIVPYETGNFFERDNLESMASIIDDWFMQHDKSRESIREFCYNEIDQNWTPRYQMNVIKNVIG